MLKNILWYDRDGSGDIMIIKGDYSEAKVFVDTLEPKAHAQIKKMCDAIISEGVKIRIMPDVHVGKGSVIGTTMEIKDKVVPNLVGVDIGCGLIVSELKDRIIDFKKLDKIIKEHIPSGFEVRTRAHPNALHVEIENLRCKDHVDIERAYQSIGTLGGGNHFIEINEDEHYQKYLVIHSGSRHLGLQVAEYYQDLAQKHAKRQGCDISDDLAYLEGQDMKDYLHDMKIIQAFAYMNRKTMSDIVIDKMNFEVIDTFQTIHNYIDTDTMILRKGAVSSQKGERFILPLNMADGSIILTGKGNPDWNYSAPHGAGRIMSRSRAKRHLKLKSYQDRMVGVYSSSISFHTLDEAPQVYKEPEDILKYIEETAKVEKHLKSIYNFKAK